jgi:hypothetical protein
VNLRLPGDALGVHELDEPLQLFAVLEVNFNDFVINYLKIEKLLEILTQCEERQLVHLLKILIPTLTPGVELSVLTVHNLQTTSQWFITTYF